MFTQKVSCISIILSILGAVTCLIIFAPPGGACSDSGQSLAYVFEFSAVPHMEHACSDSAKKNSLTGRNFQKTPAKCLSLAFN